MLHSTRLAKHADAAYAHIRVHQGSGVDTPHRHVTLHADSGKEGAAGDGAALDQRYVGRALVVPEGQHMLPFTALKQVHLCVGLGLRRGRGGGRAFIGLVI